MRYLIRALSLTFLSFIFLTAFVFADDNRYVRLRYVEGDVTLYSADGQRPNEATMNMPILDGDELVTENGRAELAFRNGVVVRLGDYSSVRMESSYSPMTIELRQGSLFVDSHLVDTFRDELRVRAGDAEVFLIDEGNLRVDLGTEGTVRVTTIDGEAEVRAAGRRVLLEAGERTYVDPGAGPERASEFDGSYDELDDWNQERMDFYARGDVYEGDDRYLNGDLYYDGYDLYNYGDWRTYGSYGNVWVPHVGFGWRPYYNGRWVYCNSGWFWVSYEPWGWAPYHYGRWGWGLDIGWYWTPGYTFAPAWVSWYDYGDYIGWCPLNYWNRPIIIYNNYNRFYPAVQKQKTLSVSNAWSFVRKKEIGATNVSKILADPDKLNLIKIDENRVVKSPDKQLVNYVLPKTIKGPAYVNDQRPVKQPGDIKNPVGIKHRDEQFEGGIVDRGKGGGSVTKTPPRSVEKPRDQWERGPQGVGGIKKPEGNNQPRDVKPIVRPDRDSQFQRKIIPGSQQNREKGKPSDSFVSPYYKGSDRSRESSGKESSPSWYRDPDAYEAPNSGGEDRKEINPRYQDEARKIFERFEESRRSGSPPSSSGSSARSSGSESKYHAPAVRNNSGGNRGSSPSRAPSKSGSSHKSHSSPVKKKP